MADSPQLEVEAKVLLGEPDNVQAFLAKLQSEDPNLSQFATSDQLNHYFQPGDQPGDLLACVGDLLSETDRSELGSILKEFSSFSLRTRLENGKLSLVIKTARDGGDDDHALSRVEGEYRVSTDDIDELDGRILKAGFAYLSKWSRERQEYHYKDYTVCLDKNAGYGYLAEVEKVVNTETEAREAREGIMKELDILGFEELSQERLGRMFKFYNQHWAEYYQTDKTFTVT